jgi:hypothetical protein
MPMLISVAVALSLIAVAFARPAGRDSLRVSDHLSALGRLGSTTTVALAIVIAVILAPRTRDWSEEAVLGEAAVVQALFPIAPVLNASIDTSSLDFTPLVSGYGVPPLLLSLPCVAVASHRRLARHQFDLRPAAPQ